jgi:hypothetical protein
MASNFIDSKRLGLGDLVLENYDGSHSVSTRTFTERVAPSDITLSASSVDEDVAIGTTIGTLSSTDDDLPNDAFTYTIDSDPDSKFQISGDSLQTAATLDFATSSSHTVTIRSTDSYGLFATKQFTITVLAVGSTKSISFNGVDEYISRVYETDIDFSITVPFSYSMWTKIPSGQIGGMAYFSIFGGSNDRIVLDTANGIEINITMYYQSLANGVKLNWTTATTKGQWQNIVFTYDGSETKAGIKIYIDGSDLGAPNVTFRDNFTGDFQDSSPFYIGYGPGTRYFEGNMDEFGIWNKELSSTEVTELYNSGMPKVLSSHSAVANLVRWYKMGEGDTMPTVEEEQTNKDGTATNMDASNISTDVAT